MTSKHQIILVACLTLAMAIGSFFFGIEGAAAVSAIGLLGLIMLAAYEDYKR